MRRNPSWLFFGGSGLLLVGGVQILYVLNASHEWRQGIGLFPLAHWHLLPGSASAAETIRALWLALWLAASMLIAAFPGSKLRNLLMNLLVAGAAVMAVAVLYRQMNPRILHPWTRMFVSRNHFAAFACLVFPLALTNGARAQYRAFRKGRLSNPSGLSYLVAGLLACTIIMTGSRAGMAVVTLQAAGFGLILWRNRRRYPFAMPPFSKMHKGALLFLAAWVLLAGAYDMWRNPFAAHRVQADLAFRSIVMGDTWAMWRSQPWWGTGPGTFATVFPYYQTLPLEQYYFKHAHCDPLQFLAEFGIFGGGLTLIGFLLILKGAVRHRPFDTQVPAFKELQGAGLLLALGGGFLHSLVDFPLRHPMILLLVGVWIGLLAGRPRTPELPPGRDTPH